MMQSKMKQLDLKETSSKSLLANVLDMDDDYRPNHKKNIQISTVNRTFYRYTLITKYLLQFVREIAVFFFHYQTLNPNFTKITNLQMKIGDL